MTLGNPFMQKNPFLCRKFSFGHEPFLKQCPQLTCFPFTCNIGIYNWMTFCTHKKQHWAAILCRNSLFVQKISFGHEPFPEQCTWLISLSFACDIEPTIEWPFAQVITTLIIEQITTKQVFSIAEWVHIHE